MRDASRGFSLLEVAVAAGIFALLCIAMLSLIGSSLHFAGIQAQRDAGAATVGALTDKWRAEEDSAWAIFTPPADVKGASNADGHEVDFFTRDGKNRSYFWAYTYDAAAQTVTRYLYPAPGDAAVKDETFPGVTKFFAHTYAVTALQDPASPVYSPLYSNAVLQPGAVRFYPASAPWIDGGNQITDVRVETASRVREMQLATQTAPSGFTVVFRYTPAPAATTGPLVTLGKIVFEPGSIAYDAPSQRLARGLNVLLGGGEARAQSPTCGYAQLFLQDGSADSNGKDGFNATDSRGCVTDSTVRLWATEKNYVGTFFANYPVTDSCLNYLHLTSPSWQGGRYVVVTPVSGASQCFIQVESSDRTITNGQAASVAAVVDTSPCVPGNICFARWIQTSETYLMKCAGGGAYGPPCPFGGGWFWRDSYSVTQYSSTDGGNTWTDLGASYDCFAPMVLTNQGPQAGGTSCTPARDATPLAYDGKSDSWRNMQTSQQGSSAAWNPSAPPAIP